MVSKIVPVAVRRMVEWILRSGDIDSRFVEQGVMQQGSSRHKMLQSEEENYQPEVGLRVTRTIGNLTLIVTGRADGVIRPESGGIIIDEIKTTTMPLDRLRLQREVHLAQGKCYAYMLLETPGTMPESVGVRLTYNNLITGETTRETEYYMPDELESFFDDLIARYAVWLNREMDWQVIRDNTASHVKFPFPEFRAGQRKLSGSVYKAINSRETLFASAPTGIGKTLSTLFPAVKAQGEGKCGKIFYLTAKTVTRTQVGEAMTLLSEKGLRMKTMILRAKDKLCPFPASVCAPDSCVRARGHYDRVNAAITHVLDGYDLLTPEVIESVAGECCVCPFELSLDAALYCDLIVGDYNHVYDPVVYLRRFFNDNGGDYAFLVDEAHNLPERVRSMYSAKLCKSAFYNLKRDLKDKNKHSTELRKQLNKVNRYCIDKKKELELEELRYELTDKPDREFCGLLDETSEVLSEWLTKENGHSLSENAQELFFAIKSFLFFAPEIDEHYCVITEIDGGDVISELFCLDPSEIIREKSKLARSSVYFSATLEPMEFYINLLGGGDKYLTLPSPFDQERLLLLAHTGISTRYTERENSIDDVCRAIGGAVSSKSGNYMVYFSSYEYMRKISERFAEIYGEIDTVIQHGEMNEQAREIFLARFDAANSRTLVGFCVLGGIFSEGIDLKAERLIGVIVVGVGLPGVSLRQNLIRSYFNNINGEGFNYAYVYPGMNKVLQAAGRVIRDDKDYGAVILIDERFGTALYRSLYPSHWGNLRFIRQNSELEEQIIGFTYFQS